MNRTQARQFVTETFTHAFDKTRFHNFILNVLNHLDESKAQKWNATYVKDAFRDHVHAYERLGTYTSPDKETLDVLVVHLTSESKLERARTSIRNFVADHLKNRDEKDAALVAFVSPSETAWRFSYVKMEYATVAKESGKVGVETKLTPARRFSYIVGEGESCHTAQARFLNLLGDTDADPILATIEEAFSVEAVTKEFFTKYAELFLQINSALEGLAAKDKVIRAEFVGKSVNTVDFAKKLMGQIVFLYFLQKKGWLGVANGKDWGTGPHDFLRRLASGGFGKFGNFFNDILEPLFYDTLATDRGHEAWCDRFKCRIPFLNGGLFEPLGDYNWGKIDIHLPNRLFTNADYVDEGVTGTGVLDVFDRYNFTVNEAEPLETEVAIDPEMLGKVFENLIEENRRKGLGAYYTPREIVHYMCQEALINYLDTALNKAMQQVPRSEIETFIQLGEQISHYEAVDTKYTIKMPKGIQRGVWSFRWCGLAMSQCLVSRIESSSRISLCTNSEIVALEGQPDLQSVTWVNRSTGERTQKAIEDVFVMIGAEPNTGWLYGTVQLDKKGFVLTGTAGGFENSPYATSVPGIYAIGDVRANSVKRVASAVGEGSVVITDVQRYLANERNHMLAEPDSALGATHVAGDAVGAKA